MIPRKNVLSMTRIEQNGLVERSSANEMLEKFVILCEDEIACGEPIRIVIKAHAQINRK